jgi:hypothetical protein
MPLQVLLGPVIEEGESLSGALDCTSGSIVRLTMPASWTPANLTFAISSDGQGFNDLFRLDGSEIMIPVTAGSAVVLAPLSEYLKAVAFLKVRSGSRNYPVPQLARREFAIAIEVAAAR